MAFIAGVLFAMGLVLGGMTDPQKVLAFLDLAGHWDPSLAFVMGAAIAIYAPAYRWSRTRSKPVFDDVFHMPVRRDLDPPLVLGAILFGIGWGLSGLCPGPALVSAMSFRKAGLLFVAALLSGMALFTVWQRARSSARHRSSPSS